MIKRTDNAQAEQARRLRIKTQDQRLVKMAVDGTGLSPWEAETLVEVVKEVFFTEPQDNPLRSGQMFYECADASEGAGKPFQQNPITDNQYTSTPRLQEHEVSPSEQKWFL